MGLSSRNKGRAAEQQVVRLARSAGLPARRCWANAQHSDAGEQVKDVEVAGDFYQVQVARAGFERIYRELAGVRGFIFRRDRGEWLVALRLADYLELLKRRGRRRGSNSGNLRGARFEDHARPRCPSPLEM